VLEETNAAKFAELAGFVAAEHRAARGAGGGAGRQRLPAALAVAGGVNSADHAQTFPALVDLLRRQARAPAALHPLGAARLALSRQARRAGPRTAQSAGAECRRRRRVQAQAAGAECRRRVQGAEQYWPLPLALILQLPRRNSEH